MPFQLFDAEPGTLAKIGGRAVSSPLREKRAQLANDTDYVLDVLKEGGKRAKMKAEKKMEVVRQAIGVKLY